MVVLNTTAAEVVAESHEVRVCRPIQRHYELRSTVTVELRATDAKIEPRVLMVWPFPNADGEYNSQQYGEDGDLNHVYGNYPDFVLGTTIEGCDLEAARWIESRYASGHGFVVATLTGPGTHTVRWRWYGHQMFAATAALDTVAAAPIVKTVTLHHSHAARWATDKGAPPQQRVLQIATDLRHGLVAQAVQCRVVGVFDDIVATITPETGRQRSPSPTSNCTIS